MDEEAYSSGGEAVQHEFNNRIAAQRAVLRVVNHKQWTGEQLFGLSSKAIDRWIVSNHLEPSSQIVRLVKEIAAKMFFLANRSQEQISDEYIVIRAEIIAACDVIRIELGAPMN
jgi:hypothetical protein